jgi:hypothetical protein
MSDGARAIVRQELEKLDFVSRTWIEWEIGPELDKRRITLVVEVTVDIDPNTFGSLSHSGN